MIARDLELEDAALQRCVEEGRLDEWWKGIVDATRSSARNEADRVGAEESERNEAEHDFREKMRREDQAAWGADAGTTNGSERRTGAIGRGIGNMDEEGDVRMEM